MEYNIITARTFDKEVKRLRKRYSSIGKDLEVLFAELSDNPTAGIDLGGGFRKIRMRIASKGRGKSGGARVITFTVVATVSKTDIVLLYIYDKAERSSISKTDIENLLERNELMP